MLLTVFFLSCYTVYLVLTFSMLHCAFSCYTLVTWHRYLSHYTIYICHVTLYIWHVTLCICHVTLNLKGSTVFLKQVEENSKLNDKVEIWKTDVPGSKLQLYTDLLQSLKRELVITLIALQRGTYFHHPTAKRREIKERRVQLIREIKKEDSTIGQGDKREERMIVGEMKERRVQSGR